MIKIINLNLNDKEELEFDPPPQPLKMGRKHWVSGMDGTAIYLMHCAWVILDHLMMPQCLIAVTTNLAENNDNLGIVERNDEPYDTENSKNHVVVRMNCS